MSFFDEADEPETAQREPRRTRGGPPTNQQTIQTRRIVAVVVIIVIIVIIALLINGLATGSGNSALQDYNNAVYNKMKESTATGRSVLRHLGSGESTTNLSNLVTQLDSDFQDARSTLNSTSRLSVPSEMAKAQQYVLLTLTMRSDGIQTIANNIQSAMSRSTSKDGVEQIVQGTSNLYGSDIVYKKYAVPALAGALTNAGIQIGPTTIFGGQVVHDLGWLNVQDTATMLGATLPASATNKVTPGLHGHALTSVVASGNNTLEEGVTNTVPAKPPPTFTLAFTNGGVSAENDVGCKVSIKGLNDTGTATVPRTEPGQSTTCDVKLPAAPKPGTYQVTAMIEAVPGEKNLSNNSMTFTITFSG